MEPFLEEYVDIISCRIKGTKIPLLYPVGLNIFPYNTFSVREVLPIVS